MRRYAVFSPSLRRLSRHGRRYSAQGRKTLFRSPGKEPRHKAEQGVTPSVPSAFFLALRLPRRHARPLCKTRRRASPLRPPGKSPEAHRKPCAAKLRQQAGGGGRSSPSKHQEKRRLTRRRLCALPFLLKRRTPFPAPMFLKHGVLIPPHVPHRAGRARKAPRLLPPLRQHAPACRYARGWQKKAKGLPPRPAREHGVRLFPCRRAPGRSLPPFPAAGCGNAARSPIRRGAALCLRKRSPPGREPAAACYRVRKSGA